MQTPCVSRRDGATETHGAGVTPKRNDAKLGLF
jgi:hypothetical protein